MDIRHGPTALDLDLQHLLDAAGVSRVVVLTKADKVGRGQRIQMQRQVELELGSATRPLAVSVRAGEGRRELLQGIDDLVNRWWAEQRGD